MAPRFLRELRANGGFVTKACSALRLSKQTVYEWRKADLFFAEQWDKAIDEATEDLEKEAIRRAYEGVEEPVFYKGVEVSRIRKYSDVLLMFTIKARKPEYRDSLRLTVDDLDSLADAAAAKHGLPVPAPLDETERPAS